MFMIFCLSILQRFKKKINSLFFLENSPWTSAFAEEEKTLGKCTVTVFGQLCF